MIKLWQSVSQAAEFKFESQFEPVLIIWQSLSKVLQKAVKDFECKINNAQL